ncbi:MULTISPECIES: thioredoxin [unclassified Amycolatopsis]|uniref:thioredoxin n=1 Tax=unclassified Amycolatopsis TaxID=2618356 RepID=UPI00345679E6
MSTGTGNTSGTTGTVVCEHCGHKNRLPAAAAGKPTCGHCHEPLPWIVDAGETDFAEVAEQATMPVLVDLWAAWCGPCRQVSPALAQLARERAGKVKLVKVDVDNAPGLAQRFDVKAVPTLMVLRGGEVVARQAGAAPVNVLREWLDQAIARPESAREVSHEQGR